METPGCNFLVCPCFGTVDIPVDRVLESAKQQYVRVSPVQVVSLASVGTRDLTLVFLPGRLQTLESLQMSSFSNWSYFDGI